MTIRDRVTQEVVEIELFHTYQIIDGKRKYTYEIEGYDKAKIEAEGSTWIVYVMDCMREYYQKNKARIDKEVTRILRSA